MKTIRHFYHVSLSSSWNEKYFRQKFERKSKHAFYAQHFFLNRAVFELMWKKYSRARQATDDSIIWRMRFAC